MPIFGNGPPFVAILAYAAFKQIPDEVHEAAMLDGAGRGVIFWRIMLPMSAPFLLAIFLLRLIMAFKTFDILYILTFGGPGAATTMAEFQIWRTALRDFGRGHGGSPDHLVRPGRNGGHAARRLVPSPFRGEGGMNAIAPIEAAIDMEEERQAAVRVATSTDRGRATPLGLGSLLTLAAFLFFFLLPIAFPRRALVQDARRGSARPIFHQQANSRQLVEGLRSHPADQLYRPFADHRHRRGYFDACHHRASDLRRGPAGPRQAPGLSDTLQLFAPPVVALLPLFFLMRWLGLLNSIPGMIIVYGIMNIPVAYWLLRGFVTRIPLALDEAAWIDGAGYLRTFFWIDLPLLSPGLVAAGIVSLILAYNEFLFASLFAPGDSVRGLTVAISLFQGDRFVNFGQMAVASLAGIAPIYLIAFFFQNRLLGGLTAGSVR